MNAGWQSAAWELPAAACAGAGVGWIVARAVERFTEPSPERGVAMRAATRWTAVAVLAVVAAALWWWECMVHGQLPDAVVAGVSRVDLAWRWAGHLAFFGVLAAAAWIDLRDRVIPDAITVPGVLAGLAWAAARPASLPPVSRSTARTFAAPLVEPDVLGVSGPLGASAVPEWLAAAPAVSGLAAAAAVYVAWWLACTAAASAGRPGRLRVDPRAAVLAAGLTGVAATWWCGGDNWAALVSALGGLAVGVAVVWGTRIGASRALGREALGFGDVTLMAAIGAWLGWQGTLIAGCLGVFVGLVHGVVGLLRAGDNELPFGPGLCVGAAVVVVAWKPLWERLGPAFENPLEIGIATVAVIVLTGLTLAAWWRLRRV